MGLREQAALDLQSIVESAADFGWPITITNPDGESAEVIGLVTDVSESIDPGTGISVSGRTASIALSLLTLRDLGLGIPEGVPERSRKPWIVETADVMGDLWTYKVRESRPDRALGIITCLLEGYRRVEVPDDGEPSGPNFDSEDNSIWLALI